MGWPVILSFRIVTLAAGPHLQNDKPPDHSEAEDACIGHCRVDTVAQVSDGWCGTSFDCHALIMSNRDKQAHNEHVNFNCLHSIQCIMHESKFVSLGSCDSLGRMASPKYVLPMEGEKKPGHKLAKNFDQNSSTLHQALAISRTQAQPCSCIISIIIIYSKVCPTMCTSINSATAV